MSEKEMEQQMEETTEETTEEVEQEVVEEAETEATSQEEEEKESKTKKSSKKKEKKEKQDKKDLMIEELNDKVKRQMAEFENFRKRSEKEKSQMYEIGAKSIIEKILPVVDNFERGLLVVEEGESNPFVDGMQMVYKQMLTSLSEAGVTQIEAVGKEFDPEYHNAVMHIEDDNFGENEIVEELQKGYMYKESVVRHSLVKVAN